MSEDDTILGRFKAPDSPASVDAVVLAAAEKAAAQLLHGGNGVAPVASEKKSYDGGSPRASNGAKPGAREQKMETIVFPCPACGTKYSVPEQHAGKTTACKKCGANITVPVPQVANPTIIGGTRTIRRADIEDAGASERAAPVMKSTGTVKKPTAPIAKGSGKGASNDFGVDMKGGASVLRKEETVISHPPVSAGHGTRGPRTAPPPPSRGVARAPQGRQAPMPGAPGYGAPKKAGNPMLLYGGIGGGVLLILIVIIAIAIGGNSGTTPNSNKTAKDGGGSQPAMSDDERLLKELDGFLSGIQSKSMAEVKDRYIKSRDKARSETKFKDKFKDYQNQFQRELDSRLQNSTDKKEVLDTVLMLSEDGYNVDALTRRVHDMLEYNDRYVERTDAAGKRTTEVNPRYLRICELLGFKQYMDPAEFEDFYAWEIEGYSEWAKKLQQTESEMGDRFFSPAQLKELKELEEKCRTNGNALKARHAKDGFAINAREAYVRFKGDVAQTRKKIPAFSPKALGRENEKFEEVWGYTYWKPFIVYIEKAAGRDVEELQRNFATKANMLMQLWMWFEENIKKPFKLQRVLPTPKESSMTTSRKKEHEGRKFETPGQLAEAEGWPMQIFVLKDSQTYLTYLDDYCGGGIPGARAHYSPPDRHIVTWDDPKAQPGNDEEWSNESTLLHEAFHMLSDHYATSPIDYKFTKEGGKRVASVEGERRPRYFNVLVQEGLTDSVAGFTKSDSSATATYKFLDINHSRLKDWKFVYEKYCNKKVLYRIEDMLKCTHYGQCQQVGWERWQELKLKGIPQGGFFLSVYYSYSCQASTFFYRYNNGKYREAWMNYIQKDYTTANGKSYTSTSAGMIAFKEAFGIKDEKKDFATLNDELVKFTLELEAKDVGKDTSGQGVGDKKADEGEDKKEEDKDGIPNSPQGARGISREHALPSREEERRLAA